MGDIERLLDKASGEIECMQNTRAVVGDPISVEGNTLIPLLSVGFGFGVDAGEVNGRRKGAASARVPASPSEKVADVARGYGQTQGR